MDYTEGPWVIGGLVSDEFGDYSMTIEDEVGGIIATTCINGSLETRDANAERIVLCVNACDNISNKELSKGVSSSTHIRILEAQIAGLREHVEFLISGEEPI